MDILKPTTVSGWWKKLCPEAVNDVWGFPNQQDKMRNSCMLASEVLRKGHILRRLISRRFLSVMLLS
jgi:hypothetical protein